MRGVLAIVGSILLIASVGWAAAALVPACGAFGRIAASWTDWCPVDKRGQTEEQLAVLSGEYQRLVATILERERELAAIQCRPQQQSLIRPPEPAAIDQQDWDSRRIGLLEGCWDLDSRFTTTSRSTGEQSRYNHWTMCFDDSGAGREEMRADNGNTCTGAVTGQFAVDGALVIDQPGDLQCSDGGFIYRMRSACKLNETGSASCTVTHPEVGGSTVVEFRRSAEGN